MVVWFTVLLFSNKNYFLCSIIILLASLLNIVTLDILKLTDQLGYIEEVGILLKIDGCIAFILTTLYFKDKLAFKMSLLLAFSVCCHTMIIYDLTVHSSFVSNLFYAWYDELIITVGLLQMVISSDGITSALRNIREHLLRISFYSWCYSKSFTVHKNGGERA